MRWSLAVPALLLLAPACAEAEAAPVPGPPPTLGVVVTDHPEATKAGVEVLEAGGTAFDAAVAAALVLGVVSPHSSGLGGGGFAVYRTANGVVGSVDFRETAPSFFAADTFAAGRDSRRGAWAAGVPGEAAGLWRLHQIGGASDWADLVEEARVRASEGFTVGPVLAKALSDHRDGVLADPGLAGQFTAAGEILGEGDLCTRPALAATLSRLTSGPSGFYEGETAESLAAFLAGSGAPWTAAELAAYRVAERPVVEGSYRGHRVVSMGPPSSGGIALLETLALLEEAGHHGLEPREFEWGSVLTRALTHAFADRAAYGGDPDFVEVPVTALLDPELAGELWAASPPEGPIPTWEAGLAAATGDLARLVPDDGGTSHLSVIDAAGNAVALTTTVNLEFGAMVADPATGIVLNDEMDDFAARPGVPNAFGLVQGEANAPAPGKRPLSSMSPTLVLDVEGRPVAALGASGGPRIITATLQVLLGLLDQGLGARAAVDAPRLHHQWLPETVFFDDGYPEEVVAALAAAGFVTGPLERHGVVQAATASWGVFPMMDGAADDRKGGGRVPGRAAWATG